MFYIASVIINLIVNKLSNDIIKEKILDMGYICKGKKPTLGKLIWNLILILTPYLNILNSLFNGILTLVVVSNDEILLKFGGELKYSPERVKFSYERENISKKVLEDMLTLDGADKEIVEEELKKVKSEKNGLAKKEKLGYFTTWIDDSPTFTKKDYDLACAQELANQMLFEIECNTNLTKQEKVKILSLFRVGFLNDIKGKKKDTVKPVEKTLRILKNK